MTDLAELLERLRAATGPVRELDAALASAAGRRVNNLGKNRWRMWLDGNWAPLPPLISSIDAIAALIERELPGWRYDLHSPRHGQSWEGIVMEHGPSRRICVEHCATGPLALCAAFLSAKITEAQP